MTDKQRTTCCSKNVTALAQSIAKEPALSISQRSQSLNIHSSTDSHILYILSYNIQ